MINPHAHLREDLLSKKSSDLPSGSGQTFSQEGPPFAATRDGFGKALLELGETNKDIVVVCADLAESTRVLPFKEKYPDRYVEVGVAEQNLATVAAGLAAAGKIPFITSYATFSPGRNNEQIRTTIALNQQPVKIAGSHAGLSVGPDGATHQALEDVALMRVLPNMTVIVPCDAEEARKATLAAAALKGPVYLRLGRAPSAVMTTAESPFAIGKAQTMWHPEHAPEVVVFASGQLLWRALQAAKELEHSVPVEVINLATIKPLDEGAIVAAAQSARAVVTVEEHQLAGGMGSAVAEVLAQACPVPHEFVAVRDRFGQSGTPEELIEQYGLGTQGIIDAITKAHTRRASH